MTERLLEYTLVCCCIIAAFAVILLLPQFEEGEDIGEEKTYYSKLMCQNICPNKCNCIVRDGQCLISKSC